MCIIFSPVEINILSAIGRVKEYIYRSTKDFLIQKVLADIAQRLKRAVLPDLLTCGSAPIQLLLLFHAVEAAQHFFHTVVPDFTDAPEGAVLIIRLRRGGVIPLKKNTFPHGDLLNPDAGYGIPVRGSWLSRP